jgi:type II secretory pathway pseudopilin PulG
MTTLVALTRTSAAIVAALTLGAMFQAAAGQDSAREADEARRAAEAIFEALDQNADQQLSKIEAAADRRLSDTFAAADADADGYLSRAEYLARPKS